MNPLSALRVESDDATLGGWLVCLDAAAHLARVVFDLALRRVEGVADRDIDVLVRVVRGRLATHDELAARNRDVRVTKLIDEGTEHSNTVPVGNPTRP